ncbi:MAG TPA: carnitine dehydratase [Alphaproteobacteria bacterium]|nr:carnitine dehydratase [Alphaproteobacteria bacterium]HAJ47629.1 carnitine dehydratase [Alphaproteobacteria bacterium]
MTTQHSTNRDGALAGLRVLDLSRVLAGPYATQILGDHGAHVIKVEPPIGDETREWGPPFREPDGPRDRRENPSAYYLNINRNKVGIALDLSHPEARAIVLRMLETADVLVENFKIGTMEKWGLGYAEVLAERFPRLIYARISGYGAEGPLGGMPGYDAVVQTMAGLSSTNGTPASGPVKVGVPIVDMVTGLNTVIGILMALHARQLSGRGQFIDMSLYDAAVSILHPHTANWLWGQRLPKLMGNAHPSLAPYDLFETATRPVFLGVGNDAQFKKACVVLGCPQISADPRFTNVALRNQNREVLTEELAAYLSKADGVEIVQTLLEAGVPAGTLNSISEVLTDPQARERNLIWENESYKGTAPPVRLSNNEPKLRHTPPDFGQHNNAVLNEFGYTDDEIATLVKSGAVRRLDTP